MTVRKILFLNEVIVPKKTIRPTKSLPIRWFVLFALLFSVQVVPRIFSDSLTNDEPLEITNGYAYLTQGDVLSHHRHPPLAQALQALPLLSLSLAPPPRDGADYIHRPIPFFFQNNHRLDAMTVAPRFMTLLCGLGIGWLLFLVLRRKALPWLMATLALWAFEPTLLAFSGYAMADVPMTLLFFASVLGFEWARGRGGWWDGVAGALVGLAACTKYSALALIPLFLFLDVWAWRMGRFVAWPSLVKRWSRVALGFTVLVGLVYLPATLLLRPIQLPYHYFFAGLKDLMDYGARGHAGYFLGQAGTEKHWLYFPIAFVLKSALPFLVLLFLWVLPSMRRGLRVETWIWLSPLVFFLAVLPVQNLGVRYLLPAYPFLILLAARTFATLWEKGSGGRLRWVRWAGVGLLAWQVVSVAANYPGHLSYFNDLVARRAKFGLLGDSNLDLAQDNRRLAHWMENHKVPFVKLAYFGGVDPAVYGVQWALWTEKDLEKPQPGFVYAVNASFLQLAPSIFPFANVITDSWLKGTPFTHRVGDTWYLYAVPGRNEGPDKTRRLRSAPHQLLMGLSPTYD